MAQISVYGTRSNFEVSLPRKATRMAAQYNRGSPLPIVFALLGYLSGPFAWLLRTFRQFRQYRMMDLHPKKALEHCSTRFNCSLLHNGNKA